MRKTYGELELEESLEEYSSSGELNQKRKRVSFSENLKIKKEKEERLKNYTNYLTKYVEKTQQSIIHINFLLKNLLEKNDVEIKFQENVTNKTFVLRKKNGEKSDGEKYYEFTLKISSNSVYLYSQDSISYNEITLLDSTTYIKWKDIIEEKYFDQVNRDVADIFKSICSFTKLNRKNIFDKLMEEDEEMKKDEI